MAGMVLVVVDFQVDVAKSVWDAPRITANLVRAVAWARREGVPVIWVQHDDAELPRGSAGWEWIPELRPAAGEGRVYKNYNSGFEATDLEQQLRSLGATTVILGGAATNWCIRATAYGALERGFNLVLLADCHSCSGLDLEEGRGVEARDIVTDLNVTMQWLTYPGRTNRALAVAELEAGAVHG